MGKSGKGAEDRGKRERYRVRKWGVCGNMECVFFFKQKTAYEILA